MLEKFSRKEPIKVRYNNDILTETAHTWNKNNKNITWGLEYITSPGIGCMSLKKFVNFMNKKTDRGVRNVQFYIILDVIIIQKSFTDNSPHPILAKYTNVR